MSDSTLTEGGWLVANSTSDPGEWSPLGSGLLIQDSLGGSVFQLWILLGVLQGEVPLLMKPGVVTNAHALSRWTPPPHWRGPTHHRAGGWPMVVEVMGEPMENETHLNQ